MRNRGIIYLCLSAALFAASPRAEAQKKSVSPSPSAPKTPPKTAAPAPKKKPAAPRRRVARRRAPAGAGAQLQPTSQRYQEVQAALAGAGYFQGLADGKWGEDSVNALRQFQADHGLEPTGKIDALSLIKLGLGPKYDEKKAALQGGANPPG